MTRARVGLGRQGEELAARELSRCGYEVVARNWRCPAGEVDLVARQGDLWVFCEVRTRHSDGCGAPEDSLTPVKQARMVAVAESYLAEHGLGEVDYRLDLMAVEFDRAGRLARLELIESAVEGYGRS